MNCAKCWIDGMLLLEHHEGVTVMECTNCVGFWLDRNDIDDIVDVKFSRKELEKMVTVVNEDTEFTCLHCGMLLKRVNYKAEKLAMGICPLGHGWYWANPKKVARKKYMVEREKALVKQFKTKKSLKEFLRGVKSWELIDLMTKGMKGKRSTAIEKARARIEKEMKEMEERRLAAVEEAKQKKTKTTGKKKTTKTMTDKKAKAIKRKTPKASVKIGMTKKAGRPKKKK